MVALGFSFIGLVLPLAIVLLYAQRRPVGTPLSWGEAMVAAVFAFWAMFVAYGILPHQWLGYADNELGWRADKFFLGPDVEWMPFVVTYEKLRDLIAAGIYIVGLGGQIAIWAYWQNRGKAKAKALPTSAFGRPLLKPAPRAAEPSGAGNP